MKALADLIDIYNKNYARHEEWKLSDFKNRTKSMEELIKDAVWGYLPNLKRDSHQCQISKAVLEEMTKRLLDPLIMEEIKRATCFDDIFIIVYELRIPNFSSLCVYDTALRIGTMFNLYPKVIYLHRGVLDGIINLIGKMELKKHIKFFLRDEKYPYVTKDCLPMELQILEPHHIENFLCRNKEKILVFDLKRT
ncbi:hypothetical protein SB767_02945 [Bacillus sp. SIMBA_069]|uniref:hypothetical protein n=1 Tax=Bacillus wiedmannii TaxID=1890302 RepID=UPI000BF11C75|nr:hypothetical protein [Bacillus wiedmannii]PEL44845.1 hypothetical protein CN607_03800 [Bacillus wiedmannii]